MRNSVEMSYPPTVAARWRKRGLLLLVIVVLAALVWIWSPLNERALAGTSYAARITCSCHYIGGRDLSDCRKDLLPGMGLMTLSGDEAGRSVTARLLPLASQTAFYRQGQGCVLEPMEP